MGGRSDLALGLGFESTVRVRVRVKKQTNKQTNKILTENLQACFSLKGPHPSPVRLS